MKAFIAIQLLVALLAAAVAADSVRGARELTSSTKKITTFSNIKLTGQNEIAPFEGVDYASGTATVKLDYDSSRSPKWKVCIASTIHGFIPGLLHIHQAEITANGNVRVDFSSLLKDDASFSGCRAVNEALYNDMKNNPVSQFRSVSTIISQCWP